MNEIELELYAGCDALLAQASQQPELTTIDIFGKYCEEIEKIKHQEMFEHAKQVIKGLLTNTE